MLLVNRTMVWICTLAVLNISLTWAHPYKAEAKDDVARFFLYTRANPSVPQQLYTGDKASISNSYFNPARLTKIIIHGWTKSYTEIPNNQLLEAYLSHGDFNLISVDWADIAALNYLTAKTQAPVVGMSCAHFVRFLIDDFSIDVLNLVVIGHSMGAHIAGFCGKILYSESSGTVQLGAIVALDAAMPLYSIESTTARLAETDAKFVLSLHTNGLLKGFFNPIGHVSFYANNGRQQPGCGIDLDGGCAHARCVYLYAEAIQGNQFEPYYECSNFAEFSLTGKCNGRGVNTATIKLGDPMEIIRVPGIFSFVTKGTSPYGNVLIK